MHFAGKHFLQARCKKAAIQLQNILQLLCATAKKSAYFCLILTTEPAIISSLSREYTKKCVFFSPTPTVPHSCQALCQRHGILQKSAKNDSAGCKTKPASR